jgi:hypothetical protein
MPFVHYTNCAKMMLPCSVLYGPISRDNQTLPESITTRVQASGLMTDYLQIPAITEQPLWALSQAVGY